jgi:UDP-N-acetylglucosamine 4,6-dehydratase
MAEIKDVLVIGGTGSLGKEIVSQLLIKYPKIKITVLSRCEHKQQKLKKDWPNVKFVLGDVRDPSIGVWFKNKDAVFHVAALKHVDHLEENPIESIKTNILGTINVANAAIEHDVKYCMFSSTDKAVDPINVYGCCKSISEKILLEFNRNMSLTHFSVYRWGNVVNSTGSAIPFFIEQIKNRKPVSLTDERMTRFWIRIDQAVDFILNTFDKKESLTKVMIPPLMKSAKVIDVIDCISKILGIDAKINIIGLRRGEKLHEMLSSIHSEKEISSNTCLKYSKQELKSLLKPIVEANTWQRHLLLEQTAAWAKDTKPSLNTLPTPFAP